MQKFNRALNKAKLKITDMNAGAIRVCEAKFSFTHDKRKCNYSLEVRKSATEMKIFGYSIREQIDLFLWETKHSGTQQILPEEKTERLQEMREKATQTPEEVRKVVESYLQAVKNIDREFGFSVDK